MRFVTSSPEAAPLVDYKMVRDTGFEPVTSCV